MGTHHSSSRNAKEQSTEHLLAHRASVVIGEETDDHRHDTVPKPPRTDGNTPDLLGIPNEMRNILYDQLMNFAAQDTARNHMRQDWLLTRPLNTVNFGRTPAILRACTKTRDECMPMFLSRTDFVVEVSLSCHKPPCGYSSCLEGLRRLGKQNVRRIKSLTIVHNMSVYNGAKANTDKLLPLISYWNWFVPALLKQGVQARQFRWPGLCSDRAGWLGKPSNIWLDHVRRNSDYHHTIEFIQATHVAIFYLGIVEPTLRNFNCLVPRNPIANVLRQALDMEFIHECDQSSNRNAVAQGWRIVNNKRWEMKYGVAASPDYFEDLDRGPGKQSYIKGQKRDEYREWQHSWHV